MPGSPVKIPPKMSTVGENGTGFDTWEGKGIFAGVLLSSALIGDGQTD